MSQKYVFQVNTSTSNRTPKNMENSKEHSVFLKTASFTSPVSGKRIVFKLRNLLNPELMALLGLTAAETLAIIHPECDFKRVLEAQFHGVAMLEKLAQHVGDKKWELEVDEAKVIYMQLKNGISRQVLF